MPNVEERTEQEVVSNPGMSIFEAVMIAEGVDEADEATQIQAWQLLVDTGAAWSLQGAFGRQARAMIEQGILTPRA